MRNGVRLAHAGYRNGSNIGKSATIKMTESNHRMMLSIALRDCLSCFDNVLDANVTTERVETWANVLRQHGLFDSQQGVCPKHPEDICGKCGGPNIIWFVNNSIWNRVMHHGSGILCPICFVKIAENEGYNLTAWKLAPEYSLPENR